MSTQIKSETKQILHLHYWVFRDHNLLIGPSLVSGSKVGNCGNP
jgi:hypothetical protein